MTFAEVMAEGFHVNPVQDGRIHRFKVSPSDYGRSGWYAYYPDGFGVWCDWHDEVKHWYFDGNERNSWTDADRFRMEERIKEAERLRLEEHRKVADWCSEHYASLADCLASNAYLTIKGVHPVEGLKEDGAGNLVSPVYGLFGGRLRIMSLQTISVSRNGKVFKKFSNGGKTKGGFFLVGRKAPRMYMAEGIATALSIYEATGTSTVCAFNAGNLKAVSELFPKTSLTVVADNDESKVGETKARLTGRKVILMPRIEGMKGTDANDYAQRYGLDALRLGLEAGQWQC